MSIDFARMSAADIAAGYRAKQFSPVEVAKSLLERIEQRDLEFNAIWLVKGDAALSSAIESEKRWQENSPLSAVDGVPITIKDIIATAGDPTPIGIAGNVGAPAE